MLKNYRFNSFWNKSIKIENFYFLFFISIYLMDNFKGTRDRKKEKKNSKFDKNGKFSSKHIRYQEKLLEIKNKKKESKNS